VLAASLLVTLGLKEAAQPIKPRSEEFVTKAVPEFLERNGYAVEIKDTPAGTLVKAAADGCRLQIRAARPTGGSGEQLRAREMVEPLSTKEDSVSFVFEGQVYVAQPLLRTILQDLKYRFEERFGIEGDWIPALAVRASPDCARRELAWQELAGA
jgi:hypothetical protein